MGLLLSSMKVERAYGHRKVIWGSLYDVNMCI